MQILLIIIVGQAMAGRREGSDGEDSSGNCGILQSPVSPFGDGGQLTGTEFASR